MTVTAPDDLLADAAQVQPDVVDLRRRIHRAPELGLQLPDTQARVLDAIDGLGLAVRTGATVTSVVADLAGDRDGPTVLLRADMDALADAGGHRPRIRQRDRRRDACLRARRAHGDARRCGAAVVRPARVVAGNGAIHVPARRGRVPRRAPHDRRGRAGGRRRGVRIARVPEPAIGLGVDEGRPVDGVRRRAGHHGHRQGRACVDAIPRERPDAGRGGDRAGATGARDATHQHVRSCRRHDHEDQSRHDEQRHPGDRGPGRDAARRVGGGTQASDRSDDAARRGHRIGARHACGAATSSAATP